MTSRNSRRLRRRVAAWLIPTLIILMGMSWILISSYLSRSNQINKYALPQDRSAASMLDFMRRVDAQFDPTTSMAKTSNLSTINAAIQRATEAMDADRSGLSPKDLREAEYYRLSYGFRSIMLHDRENNAELDKLLRRARRYIEQSTQVSSKEANVAGAAMVVLDVTGRTEDALETADLIEAKFSGLIDSRHKSVVLGSLIGMRNRMGMLHKQLDWQTRSLDGTPLNTRDLQGKVVLVEFWSTTCGPCIADFPALKRIYKSYHDEGFEVLGVCLHASETKIKSFIDQHDLPWIQVCHDAVEGNDQWAEQFEINAVPSTMLVDQSGRVVAFGVRPLHESKHRDLEDCLKRMLFKQD